MDCRQAKDWLLDAEFPWPESPESVDVARHLERCDACRLVARQLNALEETWRTIPLPPAAERAKAEFLARLPDLELAAMSEEQSDPVASASRAQGRPTGRLSRRSWLLGGATAVAGCVAVGAGLWTVLGTTDAQASDALLADLVDWNLRLTEAQSEDDRRQLFAEGATRLRSAVNETRQSDEQTELGNALLENGTWLGTHHDPVTEAARFDGLAERLLELACEARRRKAYRQMNRLLEQYNRLKELGINPNVDLAEASGALDFDHQKNLERILLSDKKRLAVLNSLLKETPHASRQEIERALKLQRNAPPCPKPKPKPKPPAAKKPSSKSNANTPCRGNSCR
jgi:hypothetical protein